MLLRSRPLTAALIGCAVIAALSLLLANQPAYDPQAWLIWGRQIAHGTLETISGPSWKPLPVVVTAPSALLGDDPAVLIWLFVARAGGLAAIVLAWALAARLAPARDRRLRIAGAVVAAGALLIANTYLSGVIRGNSEGLLVAVVLAALLAGVERRWRLAFAFGVAAALLRPEAWPVLAVFGAWLLWNDRSPAMLALVGGSAVLVILLWFVPEKVGSGDFLRGASRAREPVADSPAQAAFPFGAVFTNGSAALTYPFYALAVVAVADAFRRRRMGVLAVAAVATAWMIAVAALAQNGFTGNLRYVTLPAALLCALAGVGVAALPRRTWVYALAVAVAIPGLVQAIARETDSLSDAANDERLFDELPLAIARAGGPAAVKSCGRVYTGPFQTQAVAWRLNLRERQVGLDPRRPGTIVARASLPIARDASFPVRARTERWVVRQSC